ncbi:Actin_related protein [Hexamita inflata]|uniref:Actin related protein n=1 Tax=Hexamita inflata TaxID=28002 RepID=A0AA86R3N1_9EUKA|nr:Actin related protein [Hexamita inflata]
MTLFKQQNANALVVDPGSYNCRIGQAIDPVPIYSLDFRDIIQNGTITDPDEFFDRVMAQDLSLIKQVTKIPFVLAVHRWTPNKILFALAEKIFTKFDTAAFLPMDLASIYYSNRHQGVFVDVGYNSTRIYSSIEGALSSICRVGWNIQQLDQQVAGFFQLNSKELSQLETIKQKYFFCPENYNQIAQLCQTSSIYNKKVTLPDGTNIDLPSHSRFSLYQIPSLFTQNLQKILGQAQNFSKQPLDVVVVGGASLLNNITDKIAVDAVNQVVAARDRKNFAFLGASVWVGSQVASQEVFGLCKEDLQDYGEQVFDRRVW